MLTTAGNLLLPVAYALFLFAFASALHRAWKRRDRSGLDLAFLATLLVIVPLIRPQDEPLVRLFRYVADALIPFALLRLVGHFRSVSRSLLTLSLAVPVIGSLAFVLPDPWFRTANSLSGLARGGLTGVAGWMLLAEARRSSGIRAKRVMSAAVGTGFFMISYSLVGSWLLSGGLAQAVSSTMLVSQGAALICYFFAFGVPRGLLGRWRRAEQARYLAQTSEREPEERGERAGDDLFLASVRTVSGSATLIAIRRDLSSSELVVTAATDPAAVGAVLTPGFGLIGRAYNASTGMYGPVSDCEPALAARLKSHGTEALVAPIVRSSEPWGVVVAVHRRGALFPEDDLSMLTNLARSAATALDHAQLIAERRQMAQRAADRRLREVEFRLSLMLDSIKDYAMLLIDSDGRIAAWHLGAQHLFGHSSEQVADRSASEVYDMTPEVLAAWLSEAQAHGHADREGTCRRQDGTTFIGATIIRPLAIEPGEPAGFVAVTRDMTDQRRMEDRLRQGQKMEAIGQLAGGVAHDFNNLLTAILGYADWLDLGLRGDKKHDQVVGIQKAAERAADLTRQLLAFSRRQILQPSSIDITNLVRELLPMLRRLIDEDIRIIDRTSTTLIGVLGDRSQIEQIILNLAVNARDAILGSGDITIHTADIWLSESNPTGLPAGPHVLLEVSDTGIGMDGETKRRAFEPFFTTKEVGRGTGLGLSTVYGIVQQMGGAIEVATDLGRGTTFRLYFPAVEVTAAPGRAGKPESGRAAETLLLVENDASLREHLATLLESNGYTVLQADTTNAAVGLARTYRGTIDLVISDIMLPGSTGPELVHIFGQTRPGLSTLFIGGAVDLTIPRTPAPGAELVRKPISSTELLRKVRQILSAA